MRWRLYWVGLVCGAGMAGAQSVRLGFGAVPYDDGGGAGVTFRVWAPNATSVHVPGSFNGWNTAANPLVREGASGIWSADLSSARPGDQYKFYLNGSVWKRDPRGRMVEHTAGNSMVYDAGAFAWGGDVRLTPSIRDLVIYELHVGAFADGTPGDGRPGTFDEAIGRLDYLDWLGINAVELMPVAEFPGDSSWGYNPADPYAVERLGYGGPDGLKRFVKACHERGMAVLLDVVHNHYGPDEMDLWGFEGGVGGGIYFYDAAGICCTSWGSRPDYARGGVRDYIRDNFRMWLGEYHVDGFRWDAVGTMLYYDAGGGNWPYIPEAATLIAEILDMTDAEYPGTIHIAEDSAGSLGFDAEWATWAPGAMAEEFSRVDDGSRDMARLWQVVSAGGFGRVLFSESHDTVGDMNGGKRLPAAIDAGNPESYWARKRSMLAAGLVLSASAVPMLFMGQEMLATEPFGDGRPLDWDRTNTQSRVVRFYRDLVRLRRNLDGVSEGLLGTGVVLRALDEGAKVLAFQRDGAGLDPCLVVIHASAAPLAGYPIRFPLAGTWYANLDLDDPRYGGDFSGAGSGLVEVTAAESPAAVSVGPYSLMVFSRVAHPDRDADMDGLPNGWEQAYFGGPTNALASVDSDGDGASNGEEYLADTLPGDAASVLRIRGIRGQSGQVVVSWQGGVNARQVVTEQATPGGMTWRPVATNLPPTASTGELVVGGGEAANAAYRIEVDGEEAP